MAGITIITLKLSLLEAQLFFLMSGRRPQRMWSKGSRGAA